jgi:hypothetical protein
VLFGNDEHMSWRLRFDVFEDEGLGVFIDLLCGNLALDDAAEKTVHRFSPEESLGVVDCYAGSNALAHFVIW